MFLMKLSFILAGLFRFETKFDLDAQQKNQEKKSCFSIKYLTRDE